MKDFGYNLLKFWVKSGLYLFFGDIKVEGLENVPSDKAVLFLPNHQSALMDVLLLAVDCKRKPYFLTRSDVFQNSLLVRFFSYLRMIPIYRIRDGRESLKNNMEVFDQCADILGKEEAMLMFPEGNHSLKRRVRPLSKGFTRILFAALEKKPNLDIRLVPVGLNYRNAEGFPDRVAIQFGEAIPLQDLYDASDSHGSTNRIKAAVFEALKQLTTHIENEDTYDQILGQLDAWGVNYLDPSQVNDTINQIAHTKGSTPSRSTGNVFKNILRFIFIVLNLPVVVAWWAWVKPKIWEPEFVATLRFGFAMLALPLYYLLIFSIMFSLSLPMQALYTILVLFIYNFIYVKLA